MARKRDGGYIENDRAVATVQRDRKSVTGLERDRILVAICSEEALMLPERLAAMASHRKAMRQWNARGGKGEAPKLMVADFKLSDISVGMAALRDMKFAGQPVPNFRKTVARAYRAFRREMQAGRSKVTRG